MVRSIYCILLLITFSNALSGQTLFDKRYATATLNCGRKVLETTDGYVTGGYQIAEHPVTFEQEMSAVLLQTERTTSNGLRIA